MLSPATFIGIARATTPATPSVQPVRVPSVQPFVPPLSAMPTAPSSAKPPLGASQAPATTPPRNLPRGSLLDLSV
jgi:hypothetical protein